MTIPDDLSHYRDLADFLRELDLVCRCRPFSALWDGLASGCGMRGPTMASCVTINSDNAAMFGVDATDELIAARRIRPTSLAAEMTALP